MSPAQRYRITYNFIKTKGIYRLKQFQEDLNNGLSVYHIAMSWLKCSERRAYELRNSIFVNQWNLSDPAKECVENVIFMEEDKIREAIEYVNSSKKDNSLKLLICNHLKSIK